MPNLEKGVQQIGVMIDYWKSHQESAEQYAHDSFG